MFAAANIHYQVADRALGLGCGGIGVVQQLVRQSGLIDAIDANVKVLKVHLPYHESDHVLNIAYNNISYDGQWGYHPLVISLANTKEPLYLMNRPANRPSHEGADAYLDKSIARKREGAWPRRVSDGKTGRSDTLPNRGSP